MSWERSQRRMFLLAVALMIMASGAALLIQSPDIDPLDAWALPLMAGLLLALQGLLASRRIGLTAAFQSAYLSGAGYLLLALNHQFSVMPAGTGTLMESTYWFAVLYATAFLAYPARQATLVTTSILTLAALICGWHLLAGTAPAPPARLMGSVIQFLLTGAVLVVMHGTMGVQYRRLMATRLAAYTDVLTGLANRRAAEERLATLAHEQTPFTLVLFDLDHFKRVNDVHGHATGDKVLRGVGGSARRHLPAGGLAARWGGEEFLLILPPLSDQDVQVMLETLRQELRHQSHGAVSGVTACFGVATAESGEHPDHVLARADAAMYSAKAQGRNDIRLAARAAGQGAGTGLPAAPSTAALVTSLAATPAPATAATYAAASHGEDEAAREHGLERIGLG
ncbi:GGDEF domain-containing protein [Deinococcus koreensis]|uniref:GGDEF domain-containing protein n=1 Tax=Deinococcus koreensis TaxID=2054903 RepID=A0A2K3UUG5_9DEIO|nr:GGDEF domain-containing protein [Deinococcus koreensis]PNY80160.1 GGDEF domain-containing protein [Deinococcus koreensis]